MANANLESMFKDSLRDIYYAEHKILKALPKMTRAAQSADLKAAFEQHRAETEGQVERLEQIFEMLGEDPEGKVCAAINGILDEGEEVMETYKNSAALDAGLVASAQAVEHYEIARYGTLASWAACLGMPDAQALLEDSLAEETATDEALADLAESSINDAALDEAA